MNDNLQFVTAIEVPEGDGVTVRRLMPVAGRLNFDPFVLWDHFDIAGGGFPDHPHRGFEAITYLFDGHMRHADNLGNRGTVGPVGAQRFTAGSGIVHSELPDGHAAGVQLWINLPQRLKAIDPDYQQLQAAELPETEADGAVVRTIVGDGSPLTLHTEVTYLDLRLGVDGRLSRALPAGHRGLVYAVGGEAEVEGQRLGAGDACFVEGADGLTVTSGVGAHLLWCFGRPHGEPIRQHGPYVD